MHGCMYHHFFQKSVIPPGGYPLRVSHCSPVRSKVQGLGHLRFYRTELISLNLNVSISVLSELSFYHTD